MFKSFGKATLGIAAGILMLVGAGTTASADIIVVNTADSGNLSSTTTGGNDSGAIAGYNNTGGEYLVLALTAGSGTNSTSSALSIPASGIDVTFGAQTFTKVAELGQTVKTFYTSVWILKDPVSGTDDITINFNANISSGLLPDTTRTAAWQFGVVSLKNVNETAGANADGVLIVQAIGQTGTTLTNPALNDNDFVLMSETAGATDIGLPNYVTPTGTAGSTVELYGDNNPTGGGSRGFSVSYAALVGGDISGAGDTVVISANGITKSSANRVAVAFDGVVPEPASLVLLALGGLALLRRKKM